MAGSFIENDSTTIQIIRDTATKTDDFIPSICTSINLATISLDSNNYTATYNSGGCSGNAYYLHGVGKYTANYDTINIPEVDAYFTANGLWMGSQGQLLLVRTAVAGISSVENQLKLNLWPNPLKQNLYYTINCKAPCVSIKIIDIMGKCIYQSIVNTSEYNKEQNINTESLAQGIYVLQVANGRYLDNIKFIKQ
jgi:hypothetical protein